MSITRSRVTVRNPVIRRAGRFSSEDIHRALSGGKRLRARTHREVKEGIRDYIRKRIARD